MSIHDAVAAISSEDAKQLAADYFAADPSFPGVGLYTGAHFESMGADQNLPTQITASDLLAVGTLSVNVPSRAAIAILGERAGDITALLEGIPAETPLRSLNDEASFQDVLGPTSPAQALWNLLRRNADGESRWGVGHTIASKIMARKRPHLIPIEDSVVDRLIGRGRKNSWRLWREALTVDGYLEERADEVREHIDRPQLSTLRTLDIVLWRRGKSSSGD